MALQSPYCIACTHLKSCVQAPFAAFALDYILAARLRTLLGIISFSLCTIALQVMRVVAMPLAAGSAAAASVAEDSAGQPLFGAAAAASWGGLRVAREVSNPSTTSVCLGMKTLCNSCNHLTIAGTFPAIYTALDPCCR